MNAILGMTELALDTPLTDDQRQSWRRSSRRPRPCCASSTTCSISPRSRPASWSWTRPTSPCGADRAIPCGPLGRAGPRQGAGAGLARRSRRCPTPSSAMPAGCGRSCSTWSATRSSSPSGARWSSTSRSRANLGRRRGRPASSRCATPASASPPTSRTSIFRAVRAGGHLDHAEIRRHRPGPDDRLAAGRPDGRQDQRGERSRAGAAPSPSRRGSGGSLTPSRSIDARSTAPVPRPAGARRRRQRHQPPHPGGMAARLADGTDRGGRRGGGHGRPLAWPRAGPALRAGAAGRLHARYVRPDTGRHDPGDGPSWPPPASSCCRRGTPRAIEPARASCASTPTCSSRSRRTSCSRRSTG